MKSTRTSPQRERTPEVCKALVNFATEIGTLMGAELYRRQMAQQQIAAEAQSTHVPTAR